MLLLFSEMVAVVSLGVSWLLLGGIGDVVGALFVLLVGLVLGACGSDIGLSVPVLRFGRFLPLSTVPGCRFACSCVLGWSTGHRAVLPY